MVVDKVEAYTYPDHQGIVVLECTMIQGGAHQKS